MAEFDARNRQVVDPKFVCSSCSLILHDPLSTNTTTVITCPQCQAPSSTLAHSHPCRDHCHQPNTHSCVLKDIGCSEQVTGRELWDHYKSEQHQQSLMNVITAIQSQSGDRDDGESRCSELEEVYEAIRILTEGSEAFREEILRYDGELAKYEHQFTRLTQNSSTLKLSIEEQNTTVKNSLSQMELLKKHLALMQRKMDELQVASYDGTFVWKVTSVQQKIDDATSGRETSIYSPPFYSSPTGYKMRARLYLHGDGNARRTHMSLFFVLMRGPHDAVLKFPFNYKVTFCLYDQTPQQRHIIDSFRPDIKSNSFQRPRSEMNIASGIPKFFPLTMIQQEGNPYVCDDTMFIKVMVDFGDLPKTLLPYALSLNPGLPVQHQQSMIQKEGNRQKMIAQGETALSNM